LFVQRAPARSDPRTDGGAHPRSRVIETSFYQILGCVVAGMGICMRFPYMALKTFPDAKLLSIHAVSSNQPI
jgi:hypothetical protein